MTDALALTNVSSGFAESMVLRGVSLSVPPGGILALLGKNGMGKTTLLRTVMGFLPAARRPCVSGRPGHYRACPAPSP